MEQAGSKETTEETMTSPLSDVTLSDYDNASSRVGPSISNPATPVKGLSRYRFASALMLIRKKPKKEKKFSKPEVLESDQEILPAASLIPIRKKSKSYIRKLGELGTNVAKNYKIPSSTANTDKNNKSLKKAGSSEHVKSDSASSSKRRQSSDEATIPLNASQTSLIELEDNDPMVVQQRATKSQKFRKTTRDLLKITISGRKKTTVKSAPTSPFQQQSNSGNNISDNCDDSGKEIVEIQTTTCEVSADNRNIVLQLPLSDNNSIKVGRSVELNPGQDDAASEKGEPNSLQSSKSGRSIVISSKPITDQISPLPPPPSVISTSNRAPFRLDSSRRDQSEASLISLEENSEHKSSSDHLRKSKKSSLRKIIEKLTPEKGSDLKSARLTTSSSSLMHLVKHPNSIENLSTAVVESKPEPDLVKIRSNFVVAKSNSSMSSSKVNIITDPVEESGNNPSNENESGQPKSLDNEIKEVITFDIGSTVRPPVTVSLSSIRHVTSFESDCEEDHEILEIAQDSVTPNKQRRIPYEPTPGTSQDLGDSEILNSTTFQSSNTDFKSFDSSELMANMPAHGDLIFDEENIRV